MGLSLRDKDGHESGMEVVNRAAGHIIAGET